MYEYIIVFDDGTRRLGICKTMALFEAELWNAEWEQRKKHIRVKTIDVWRRKKHMRILDEA